MVNRPDGGWRKRLHAWMLSKSSAKYERTVFQYKQRLLAQHRASAQNGLPETPPPSQEGILMSLGKIQATAPSLCRGLFQGCNVSNPRHIGHAAGGASAQFISYSRPTSWFCMHSC